jgi:hypothetical protein
VEKDTYDLNILVYEKTYREKIVLYNRSSNPMKIQLYCSKDLKNYMEFNPTLGYIQGSSSFEIWVKFKPDRTILTNCSKFFTENDEFHVPVKVVGANQVLPVKFTLLSRFTVNSVTFSPP